jgi:hypothetical protein
MANHILTALVQLKCQLHKQLEAIELLENSMAQINIDVLPLMPDAKPKREVIEVRRKYQPTTQMPNDANKLQARIADIYQSSGGYSFFEHAKNAAEGRHYITFHKRQNQLRVIDYSAKTSTGRPKMYALGILPKKYNLDQARQILMDYHESNRPS